MRKFSLVLLLTILLQSCSGIPFLGGPTNTPSPTATATVSSTPTITRTPTITPSITPSATIVHFPTQDPDLPTATFVPIPIFIGINTATPVSSPTPVKPGAGFESVLVSENRIFWGSCTPNKTKITAKVEDPEAVISVVIFMQVKSAKKEDYTPWTSGNVMYRFKDDTYTYIMRANDVEGHNHYRDSWVRYQLVATDKNGEEIGRTRIYTQSIQMAPCMCYEPLKGCPVETPRPTRTPKK